MQPGEKTILSHRTWIDGKPADADHDQMDRLKLIAGRANPYALEISWEDAEGKMRFQRIRSRQLTKRQEAYPSNRSNSFFTTR